DHAVDHPSRCETDPSTGSVDTSRGVEVYGGVEAQEVESEEQPPEIGFALVTSSSDDHLHDHGLRHRDGILGRDEVVEPTIDRAPRVPVVLHPGRRIGEDHGVPAGGTSAGRASMACAP